MSRKVVLYARVSTEEQATVGVGLDAQKAELLAKADSEGWDVVAVEMDKGISGRRPWKERPGLVRAVELVQNRTADAIVVAKSDRLSRRAADALSLAEDVLVTKPGEAPRLVCLEPDVDLSTSQGLFMFGIYCLMDADVARKIGERTKAALAVKRAQGVRLGRPGRYDSSVLELIAKMRSEGATQEQIAAHLVAIAAPTPQGGRWTRRHVSWLMSTQDYALAVRLQDGSKSPVATP